MEPYAGAEVTTEFMRRWRHGGAQVEQAVPSHVGIAKPRATLEIRRGRFRRRYHTASEWDGPTFGDIAGGTPGIWYADWEPEEDWIEIAGLKDHRLEDSFTNNGITAGTITLDNSVMQEIAGVVGPFHRVMHGWFTPIAGYEPSNRPDSGIERSPFYQKLPNAQVRIRTGYGDELTTDLLGLIDDIETGDTPETATINVRGMGGPMLVDQHFFGWVKEKSIRDPVIFMPRAQAEKRDYRGGGAEASSHKAGFPARGVVQTGPHSAWLSAAHSSRDVTEWVHIHVPAGRYRAIYLNTALDNHEVFVGVMAKPRGNKTKLLARWLPNENSTGEIDLDESYLDVKGYVESPDGGPSKPFGWVKFNDNVVPGENGGWPYIAHRSSVDSGKGIRIPFDGELRLGTDSVIRVGIRNLAKIDNTYHAGVLKLQGEARLPTEEAKDAKYVLVDDVSQVVECCLRWAGFKTWEIETTGVNLKQAFVVEKAKALIEPINEIKEMVGFTFFVAEPRDDNDDQDLGYPIFRQNRVLDARQARQEEITDRDLLGDARYRLTNENERYIIRARGRPLAKDKGGMELSADRTYRAMFVYRPPWLEGMAGIIKHLTHYDAKYETIADCQFAAILIALQIALSKYTATISIPGTSHIGLDSSLSLIDRIGGVNSRMYVSNRVRTFTAGEQASYVTELGGALVDTPDVAAVTRDFDAAKRSSDRNEPVVQRQRKQPTSGFGMIPDTSNVHG